MAEAAIMAASLAVGAYSAYQQNKTSNDAADLAKKQVAGQESAMMGADKSMEEQQRLNDKQQTMDAQWMQLKTTQSTARGLSTQAPYSLANQSGQTGAGAAAAAGKLPK